MAVNSNTETLFSDISVPRLYNEEQLRLRESLETAVRIVFWCEMAASLGVSAVDWSELVGE
jgi:hypothetical protein